MLYQEMLMTDGGLRPGAIYTTLLEAILGLHKTVAMLLPEEFEAGLDEAYIIDVINSEVEYCFHLGAYEFLSGKYGTQTISLAHYDTETELYTFDVNGIVVRIYDTGGYGLNWEVESENVPTVFPNLMKVDIDTAFIIGILLGQSVVGDIQKMLLISEEVPGIARKFLSEHPRFVHEYLGLKYEEALESYCTEAIETILEKAEATFWKERAAILNKETSEGL